MALSLSADPLLTFSTTWSLLGPFQIGTREVPWGADPLELYGGFPKLQPNDSAVFRSSLAPNASVTWTSINASSIKTSSSQSSVSLHIDFPSINWSFLQQIYGWSALQWQGWVRGSFHVPNHTCAVLFTPQILEYAMDGARLFGGDFYGFRKAGHVLHLEPGEHVLDMRVVLDVRAMGGLDATVDLEIEMRACGREVKALGETTVVSDVLDGVLTSEWASVDVRNNGENWIEIFDLEVDDAESHLNVSILNSAVLAPGQTKPLILELKQEPNTHITTTHLNLHGHYRHRATSSRPDPFTLTIPLTHKPPTAAHKLTHHHPSGIISYSLLLPPSSTSTCSSNASTRGAPIMLQLHGAGVEADSPMIHDVLTSFPPLCAWLLVPSDVTPWSGDDWHTWGFGDVLAAINGLPAWAERVGWKGVGVDTENWFVGGHSNGGQGTWFALTHYPDNVFAASPLSGYSSIQNYVPYTFTHPASPAVWKVREQVLASYRHELLVPNARGTPILIQHGGEDDNVPAYHSRFMTQLLQESGVQAGFVEVPGEGHWWDGVVTMDVLKRFYVEQIGKAHDARPVPEEFKIVVANPVDQGSKFGVRVLFLEHVGEMGRVRVRRSAEVEGWQVETENVLAFEWDNNRLGTLHTIDGAPIHVSTKPSEQDILQLWQDEAGDWSTTKPTKPLRNPKHFGGLDAILRTEAAFSIVYPPSTFELALQISRTLHTYFYADSNLIQRAAHEGDAEESRKRNGNRIVLGVGGDIPTDWYDTDFAIRICPSTTSSAAEAELVMHLPNGRTRKYKEPVGTIFIRPQVEEEEGLDLMIWGSDEEMLGQAARLVPSLTGVGAGDWVVVGEKARWMGMGGVGMGFFGNEWEICCGLIDWHHR